MIEFHMLFWHLHQLYLMTHWCQFAFCVMLCVFTFDNGFGDQHIIAIMNCAMSVASDLDLKPAFLQQLLGFER